MNATRGVLALTAAGASAAVLLAGCGGSTSNDASSSNATAANPSEMPDAQSPPQRLVVDVTIKGSTVTPTNAQFKAGVKEPIVLQVNSDAADELHVHSTPEHHFDVAVGQGQSFQFSVDTPGRVDVELHKLDKTIATIQVQ